jgi:MFS family permease
VLSIVFTIPVAFSNNARKSLHPLSVDRVPYEAPYSVAVHLIFRFLCGFAGASFLSVAGGTVADLFENDKLGT